METQIIANLNGSDFYIKRTLPFAIEKVFKAYSEPVLYSKWYMPDMSLLKMECKTEGAFHHTHKMADGNTYGFRGVYHEVIYCEKIIRTSEFFGLPQKLIPNLEITEFKAIDFENTEINIHTICPSPEIRDAMISHGMKEALSIQDSSLISILNQLR